MKLFGIIGGVEAQDRLLRFDLRTGRCSWSRRSGRDDASFLRRRCSSVRILRRRAESILHDNTKIAVARILGDGKRQRTRVFTELQSHYLFEDRFGRPGKGNDKGKVEGLVGYARRNFLVPIPAFAASRR